MQGIEINGVKIWQPDSGDLAYNFETTYTEDSTRTQDGAGHFTALFTVEQLGYSATNIPIDKASEIVRMIARGTPFNLTYYSMYYGGWRSGSFYVGKGQMSIGNVIPSKGMVSSLSFNMTGVNPL